MDQNPREWDDVSVLVENLIPGGLTGKLRRWSAAGISLALSDEELLDVPSGTACTLSFRMRGRELGGWSAVLVKAKPDEGEVVFRFAAGAHSPCGIPETLRTVLRIRGCTRVFPSHGSELRAEVSSDRPKGKERSVIDISLTGVCLAWSRSEEAPRAGDRLDFHLTLPGDKRFEVPAFVRHSRVVGEQVYIGMEFEIPEAGDGTGTATLDDLRRYIEERIVTGGTDKPVRRAAG